MRKTKKVVVQVHESDGSVSEVEVTSQFIEMYQKETGRKRVSAKSLSKFIDNLVKLHSIE